MRIPAPVALVMLFAAFVQPAAALMIDNFEEGNITLTDLQLGELLGSGGLRSQQRQRDRRHAFEPCDGEHHGSGRLGLSIPLPDGRR